MLDPFYSRNGITIYVGDNREVLPHIEPVHAVVTDPPYGLTQAKRTVPAQANDSPYSRHRVGVNGDVKPVGGFMGKQWDGTGVERDPELWRAISDAMLPGAHLLAFGGTRTYHRMAVAIEDAGYEIRDTLQWLYGSGFPKSHDVSKAIDKMAGAEREVVGVVSRTPAQGRGANVHHEGGDMSGECAITAPATPAAEQWQGFGTALKPSYEPIIMARLPFKGTVAANVLQHGTGAINVDACRIGTDDLSAQWNREWKQDGTFGNGKRASQGKQVPAGRWPANVILDEAAAAMLGEPSRFFYVAKASRRERNAGLEGMPERVAGDDHDMMVSKWVNDPRHPDGGYPNKPAPPKANHHPTVKPIALMRYLIQMVTPPNGIVLDPFAGSGSTLVAAAELGFDAIGIELSEEYAEIAARRVDHALNERAKRLPGLEATP